MVGLIKISLFQYLKRKFCRVSVIFQGAHYEYCQYPYDIHDMKLTLTYIMYQIYMYHIYMYLSYTHTLTKEYSSEIHLYGKINVIFWCSQQSHTCIKVSFFYVYITYIYIYIHIYIYIYICNIYILNATCPLITVMALW